MKYEVIARRYRPQKFEEVVGQESVAQTLQGSIQQERLAHAFLFAGPRGVGKTSMARIFAKALNCPVASDRQRSRELWGQPCDECATCRAIHTGQDIDVIEMDGASHRGIEDVRSIVEAVNRPATRSPFKVYLVDEVHMLTREAFNALLKTLEEPPSHVKFIFATTEAHKIPDTVLSRCQRFEFQPIREPDIVRRLSQICTAEGREAEAGLLEKIARVSKGGLRDSQTLLDQLMTFGEGNLSVEDLDRLSGRIADTRVDQLVLAILEQRAADVLAALSESLSRGADPSILLEQVLEAYQRRLQEAVTSDPVANPSRAENIDILIGSLQMLLDTAQKLRHSAHPDVAVEVTLLKLARLEDPRSIDRAIRRLEALGQAGTLGSVQTVAPDRDRDRDPDQDQDRHRDSLDANGATSSVANSVPELMDRGATRDPPDPGPGGGLAAVSVAEATPVDSAVCDRARLDRLWDQVLIEMRKAHQGIATFVQSARLDLESTKESAEPKAGGGAASDADQVVLRFRNDFYLRQMRHTSRLETCRSVIRNVTGEPWNVRVELELPGFQPEPEREPTPSPSAVEAENGAQGHGDPVVPSSRPEAPPVAADLAAPDAPDAAEGPEVGAPARAKDAPRIAEHPLVLKAQELFNGRLV